MPLEDILGITIGIPGFIVGLVVVLRFMLKKKELEMRGNDPELGPVVESLCDDLNDTRAQLAEMQEHTQAQLAEVQERLDFAERLLTAGRESQEDRNG
jgi:hypothetical protein